MTSARPDTAPALAAAYVAANHVRLTPLLTLRCERRRHALARVYSTRWGRYLRAEPLRRRAGDRTAPDATPDWSGLLDVDPASIVPAAGAPEGFAQRFLEVAMHAARLDTAGDGTALAAAGPAMARVTCHCAAFSAPARLVRAALDQGAIELLLGDETRWRLGGPDPLAAALGGVSTSGSDQH